MKAIEFDVFFKRTRVIVFVVMFAFISLNTHGFEINGINYSVTSDTKKTVAVFSCKFEGTAIVIPESVSFRGNKYRVTSIGEGAFYCRTHLTSVTIPNSVTLIGESAFAGCTHLTSVTIPNSVTSIGESAFGYCSGLTSVTIPNSVTSIGEGAFSRCSGLSSVTIPNSVTSIGDGVFSGCSGLTSVKIPNSVTTIGLGAFAGCSLSSVIIPNSVSSIGEGAFIGCTDLTSVTIGNSVTSIGAKAFDSCSGLTSVTIPNSVTSIGDFAFQDCRGLTSITIPNSVTSIGIGALSGCSSLISIVVEEGNIVYDSRNICNAIVETQTNKLIAGCKSTIIPQSVTSIGEGAFSRCSGLTSVTIPNSVTLIGESAFSRCSGLSSVTIPNSVTTVGLGAFSGCSSLISIVVEEGNIVYDSRNNCNAIVETQTNKLIAGCKSTIIPQSVTSIGELAFYDCSGLTSVTIPNSVTSIGEGAFSGCSCLTSVTIPNSVTSIGLGAFLNCSGLTSVTIPNSVTSIGEGAFSGCSGLTSVTIPNSVTSIGLGVFLNCSGLTSVTIPNSVTYIGKGAFSGCKGLTEVILLNPTPPSIEENTFEEDTYSTATLKIPKGCKTIYSQSPHWAEFVSVQMITAFSGNKSQKEGAAEGEQAKTESTWQTYTNNNYGYSIEVPGDMTKRETMTEDNGTIFSYDGMEGASLNRIDISAFKDMFDEEYTPERIKARYDADIANKELTSSECGDNYYTYSILGGEYCDEIDYYFFSGSRYVIVTLCYESDFKDKLGGDVAKHVFESIKFKKLK